MDKTSPEKGGARPLPTREDRLKAALKANMARRKAQARARAAGEVAGADNPGQQTPNQDE